MLEQLSFYSKNVEKSNFIDVERKLPSNKVLNVVSLFSGCGGMDLGFRGDFNVFNKHYEKNNYNIIFANDIVEAACKTYENYFKHVPLCVDINEVSTKDIPKADVVIGGFPCQDFSLAGNRKGLTADRGRLYLQLKRVVDDLRPLAFLAENVDGLRITSKGEDTSALDIILNDFRSLGYNVEYKLLNAANYGVPQIRKRIIIMGIRNDLNKTIYYPKAVRDKNSIAHPWMTAKEAIDDLWDKIDSPGIFNHSSKDYSKAKFYHGKKTQGNNRILADRPSCTIRAEHHGNIEGHYRTYKENNPDDISGWRRLSVRECARLQSFPDDFEFTCAASSAYKQVGNAVPPILGWYAARALYFSLMKKGGR